MTVKELITKLEQLSPDMQVVSFGDPFDKYYYDVEAIGVINIEKVIADEPGMEYSGPYKIADDGNGIEAVWI